MVEYNRTIDAFERKDESSHGYDKPKEIVLFTDAFPYGKGEKTFIIPEINALLGRYHITLVTQVSKELVDSKEDTTALPDSIDLVAIAPFTYLDYLRAIPHVIRLRMLYKEIRCLFSDGFSFGRMKDLIKQAISAECFRRACRDKGLFQKKIERIYYSFWFTYKLLALCIESSETLQTMTILGRVNGYDLYNERNMYGRQPFQRTKRDFCRVIFFGADYAREYFSSHFGSEKSDGQYVLSRLGVARGVEAPRVRGRNPFILVSCSNAIPLKHVELIAKAIVSLNNPDIFWVHFGDGPELDKIKKLTNQENCKAYFPGAVPNCDVLSFYDEHAVGAFIALSESEGGCPVALQEALSFGLPIIATAAGGAHYECLEENGCRLPDLPSVSEVASAISTLFQLDDERWSQMSTRSLEIWAERFDVCKCKDKLLEEIKRLS